MAEPAQTKAIHDAEQAIATARTVGACAAAYYCALIEGGVSSELAGFFTTQYVQLLFRPTS